MAKSKGYKRLLVFCLLAFILCDSLATKCAGRGVRFFLPFYPYYFQPQFILIGSSPNGYYDYGGYSNIGRYDILYPPSQAQSPGYVYYDYYGRYYDIGRYDILYPSPQVQSPPLQAPSPPPQGNTYNYCTFNYFDSTEGSTAQHGSPAYQRQLPQKTEVGIFYGDGVTAFRDSDYAEAAKNFQHALRQANKFMPFAYVQALFAGGNYAQAAEQLRLALEKLSPENDRILFPRFLYPSDQILLTQVEKLRGQAGSDSDLQLLIGYQLFGVKKTDEAVEFLNKAKLNSVDGPAAAKLLLMIERTKTATSRS